MAKARVKIFQQDIKELESIHAEGQLVASVSTSLMGVSVAAGALAAGALLALPAAELGVAAAAPEATSAMVSVMEFGALTGGSISAGDQVGSWYRESTAKIRELEASKGIRVFTPNSLEDEIRKLIYSIEAQHHQLEKETQKEQEKYSSSWWSLGWSDVSYVRSQLKGWKTRKSFYEQELLALEPLAKDLRKMCTNIPSGDYHGRTNQSH